MTDTKENEIQILLNLIEEKTGYSLNDLSKKSRKRKLIHVRRVFFVIAHKILKLSYPKIGGIVDQDHATVIHGLKRHNAEIDIYEDYTAVYQGIYKHLEVLFIARTQYNSEYMTKKMDILITQRDLLNSRIQEYQDRIDKVNAGKETEVNTKKGYENTNNNI